MSRRALTCVPVPAVAATKSVPPTKRARHPAGRCHAAGHSANESSSVRGAQRFDLAVFVARRQSVALFFSSLAAPLVHHLSPDDCVEHAGLQDLFLGDRHDVLRQHGDVRELADFE